MKENQTEREDNGDRVPLETPPEGFGGPTFEIRPLAEVKVSFELPHRMKVARHLPHVSSARSCVVGLHGRQKRDRHEAGEFGVGPGQRARHPVGVKTRRMPAGEEFVRDGRDDLQGSRLHEPLGFRALQSTGWQNPDVEVPGQNTRNDVRNAVRHEVHVPEEVLRVEARFLNLHAGRKPSVERSRQGGGRTFPLQVGERCHVGTVTANDEGRPRIERD